MCNEQKIFTRRRSRDYSSIVYHRSDPITKLLTTAYFLPPTSYRLLPTAYFLPPTSYCLLKNETNSLHR